MKTSSQRSEHEGRLDREILAFSRHEHHPEPGVLAAYHARTLGAEEADAVQEHLVQCRHCAALVLDLEDLLSEPVAPPVTGGFEAESATADRLVGDLGSRQRPPHLPTKAQGRSSFGFPLPIPGLWRAAALLFLGLGLGYAWRGARPDLPRRVEGLKLVQISEWAAPRGTQRGADALTIHRSLGGVAPIQIPEDWAGDGLLVEILNYDDEVSFSLRVQRPVDRARCGIEIAPYVLDLGTYRLRVSPSHGSGKPIEYTLDIKP